MYTDTPGYLVYLEEIMQGTRVVLAYLARMSSLSI